MKKQLLLLLPLFLLFQGCLGSDTPTCSDSDVKELVHEIIDDDIQDDLILSYFKNTYPDKVMQYAMLKNYEGISDMIPDKAKEKMKKADEIPEFIAAKKEMESQFSKMSLKLTSIRSTKIDDPLKKVSCSATMKVQLPDYDLITYDLNYDAQVTDDGEELIVEVHDLE